MVSIIIVNFNAGKYLLECVNSVLASTIPVEIFISDNGSVDNSIELLEKSVSNYQNVHIKKNNKNLGFAKGNNAVFEETRGEYLLFLNPDCEIKPDTIEKMILEMQKDPSVGMSGCLIRNLDGSEQAGCRRLTPTPLRVIRHLLPYKKNNKNLSFTDYDMAKTDLPVQSIFIECISGAFMLVRREAFEQIGLWDERYFMHFEDIDLCVRFRQAGWKILFVPTVEITHVKGACSKKTPFRVLFYKHKGMMLFYSKYFKYKGLPFINWFITIAVWLRFFLLVGFVLINSGFKKITGDQNA